MSAPLSRRWRRWAATALLVLMLGPLAMSVSGCFTLAAMMAASAANSSQHLVPAGDAAHLEPGRELKLHLRNGGTIEGRFRGRTLLAPEVYEPRFAARAAGGGWVPFALGETLTVDLVDGGRRIGTFRGYGMRSLVLQAPTDSVAVRLPFGSARAIRRAGGGTVSIDSLLAADVRGELPSAEGLAIRTYDSARGISGFVSVTREVPLEEVRMATVTGGNRETAGLILFGAAIDVVLFLAIREAAQEPGCTYIVIPASLANEVRFTERPFDRRLGRFVGEDVAWGGLPAMDAPETVAAPDGDEPPPAGARAEGVAGRGGER